MKTKEQIFFDIEELTKNTIFKSVKDAWLQIYNIIHNGLFDKDYELNNNTPTDYVLSGGIIYLNESLVDCKLNNIIGIQFKKYYPSLILESLKIYPETTISNLYDVLKFSIDNYELFKGEIIYTDLYNERNKNNWFRVSKMFINILFGFLTNRESGIVSTDVEFYKYFEFLRKSNYDYIMENYSQNLVYFDTDEAYLKFDNIKNPNKILIEYNTRRNMKNLFIENSNDVKDKLIEEFDYIDVEENLYDFIFLQAKKKYIISKDGIVKFKGIHEL